MLVIADGLSLYMLIKLTLGQMLFFSLQITPACNLPLKSLRGGGKIVIVNLQVLIFVPGGYYLLYTSVFEPL